MRHFLWSRLVHIGLISALFAGSAQAADNEILAKHLTFHASFDTGIKADFAKGDAAAYTGEDLSRKESYAGLPENVERLTNQGKWGGSLRFNDISPKVLYYRGEGNLPYAADGFDMTVSFWMKLDPEKDLKPGYVDPLQLTDKAWNNSSFFVDFTKDEVPRHFRLGVFSDYAHWNPKDTPWDSIPDAERPMIVVTKHPFRSGEWTHVAFTSKDLNRTANCVTSFYLNGKLQGTRTAHDKFSWNPEQVAIMLGIQYIGGIDDFAVFDQAFAADQIERLMRLEGGVAALRK